MMSGRSSIIEKYVQIRRLRRMASENTTLNYSAVESRAVKTIREVFESGRPLTYIQSSEEQRVARVLREVGARLLPSTPVQVWTWTLTAGMHGDGEAAEAGTL